MSAAPLALQQATILQHCKVLHLPTVGGQCGPLAEQAVRERHTHLGYLEVLLAAEVDERERHAIARRLKDAHLPRVKTLDEFDSVQPRTMWRRRTCVAVHGLASFQHAT
jgi:DNA replication protein DnaC